jgi:hypothetical protein
VTLIVAYEQPRFRVAARRPEALQGECGHLAVKYRGCCAAGAAPRQRTPPRQERRLEHELVLPGRPRGRQRRVAR